MSIDEPLIIHLVIEQGDEKRGHFNFQMKLGETTLGEVDRMMLTINRKLRDRLDEIYTHYNMVKDRAKS